MARIEYYFTNRPGGTDNPNRYYICDDDSQLVAIPGVQTGDLAFVKNAGEVQVKADGGDTWIGVSVTIPTEDIAYKSQNNTFTAAQDFTGGSGTEFTQAPIEIRMASYPRVSFHWPGVVASSIGMDSGGMLRTFNNPGTDYEKFGCLNIYTSGVSSSLGDITCRGATNFQGGLTVSAGVVSFPSGVWHRSSDGLYRFHFNSTATYVEGPSVILRNNGDVDIATFGSTGNLTLKGILYPGEINSLTSQTVAYWSYNSSVTRLYSNYGIQCEGAIVNTSYIYPGRADATGWQTSYYLASHFSYGLYTNTGFYIAGTVYTGGAVYVGSTINVPNLATTGGINTGLITASGRNCRNGTGGTNGANYFNINWTGSVQVWIDGTNIGTISFVSDSRIKRDFTPLAFGSLDKILQMRPGTFYYRQINEFEDTEMHLGMLAQDVLPIAPELVRDTGMVTPLTPDGGLLQISYVEMIPMLVAAIQELKQLIDKRE